MWLEIVVSFCCILTVQAGRLDLRQFDPQDYHGGCNRTMREVISYAVYAYLDLESAGVLHLNHPVNPLNSLSDNPEVAIDFISCFLHRIRGPDDMLAIFNEQSWPSYYYNEAIDAYRSLGGVEGLRDILYMQSSIWDFVIRVQLSSLPLQNSPVETWQAMYEITSMPGFSALVNFLLGYFPDFEHLVLTPEEYTRLLHTSQDVEDLMDEFDESLINPVMTLILFPVEVKDEMVNVGVGVLGIIQELDNRGWSTWTLPEK